MTTQIWTFGSYFLRPTFGHSFISAAAPIGACAYLHEHHQLSQRGWLSGKAVFTAMNMLATLLLRLIFIGVPNEQYSKGVHYHVRQ